MFTGCSVPLGMQSGEISDKQITASSVASNWYSSLWQPWLARLDKQGSVNAWQSKVVNKKNHILHASILKPYHHQILQFFFSPQSNDMQPWLQIELKDVKKVTGIVTQGAKSLKTEMFVTTYVLEYSDDGKKWTKYTDNEDYEIKVPHPTWAIKSYCTGLYTIITSFFFFFCRHLWETLITMVM